MKALLKSALVLVCAAFAVTSCTMKSQDAPPLSGPSGFGTSVTVAVSPDVLQTDGGSQSRITVTVRDKNGQPKPGESLRLEIRVDGVPVDFGSLSARSIVTNGNGEATAVYTAPAISGGVDAGVFVFIVATLVGTNHANEVPHTATIRLLPVGVVVPPSDLRAAFTSSPTFPNDNQPVVFDASTSTGTIATYRWDFGDGGTAEGKVVSHSYREPGTYAVRLTIIDPLGRTADTSRSVTVSAGTGPTAIATFSPNAPAVGQLVNFNGAGSTASAGRKIVRWDWSFGDGTSDSGVETQHAYAVAGRYTVTLLVTDDAGRTDTATVDVTVGSQNPTAAFTISPTDPQPFQNVSFNASQSTASPGRTIVSYTWDFGDGTTGSGVTFTKVGGYTAEGTYTVTLTVTDDQGNKGILARTVPVKFPSID